LPFSARGRNQMPGSKAKEYLSALYQKHGALVVIQSLMAIANTVANSFALIYLIREGYDYIACSIFILISCVVPILLLLFAARTVVKNFSASMNTGMISMMLYYASLMFLDDVNLLGGWLLILIPPLMYGIYIVTFWIPYNTLMMHITSVKARGATIGVYFLVWPLITAVGPLFGGLLITRYSYDAMFLFAIVVIASNLFYMSGFRVLGKLRERIIIPELIQSVTTGILRKEKTTLDFTGIGSRIMYGLFAEGVVDGVFWVAVPIISFQFATSESTLSQYLSLFALWGAIMTVALGYLSDRIKNRRTILRIGSLLCAVSIILATVAPTVQGYLLGMSMTYFFLAIIPAFLFTMLLDKLERYKKKGVLVREFLLNVGRVAGAATTIVLLLLDFDLMAAIAVSGVMTATIVIVR
jgi:MFS family permease